MKPKRKRKFTGEPNIYGKPEYTESPDYPSISDRMRIFGNLPWLHTCCQMIFFGSKPHYGYFQRIVIGSEYQFPEHTMTGLN